MIPRVALAAMIAVGGSLTVAVAADSQGGVPSQPRLPDLVQRTPSDVFIVEPRPGRYQLVFASAVENVGDGPIWLDASRASTRTPAMIADQLILNDDASTTRVGPVGKLRYVSAPDHSHWHYLDFDTYTLRKLRHGRLGGDIKTGFCLGDRYAIGRDTVPPHPVPDWSTNCGSGDPTLLTLQEGISVGFGDNYVPELEGQAIPITKVPAGRYRLVHHVNAARLLAETDYSNNAATATVRIRRPDGRDGAPTVRVLATCEAATRC